MSGLINVANLALRAVVVLVVGLTAAHAADNGGRNFREEMSKQEQIYRNDNGQAVEGYTVDRSLSLYTDALASGFDQELAKLGPEDRWLDIGAGQGFAILDYYTRSYDLSHFGGKERRGAKAQAIAMSIEDRRTDRWQQTAANLGVNRVQYLSGGRLREFSLDELGKFDVITDVIGGFSYTDDLSLFMQKVLSFLDVDGSFFTVLQDVKWEDGTNTPFYKGAPFLTEIVDAQGGEVKMCAWLKRIGCAEVTCESRAKWQPPMEAFRIRKVCDAVSVPALTPIHYQAGTPPERRFRLAE